MLEKENLKSAAPSKNENGKRLKEWLLDENIVIVQIVFLKLFTLIYITAFTSVFVQIPGLFGKDGLLPVSNFLKKIQRNLGPTRYNTYPTIFWLSDEINNFLVKIFPSLKEFEAEENLFHLICLANIILGLCILLDFRFKFFFKFWAFFILWASYLSIFLVGQSFLSFQWDILILETGFLAMFFVPNQRNGHFYVDQITVVARELLRWLMFRFMFANGVVKLLSGDKTWWSLTALHYHFESQPLPSPYSRYWHFLPDAIKQFGVANVFVIEIFLPILFYSPLRSLRIFSALYQIPFQIILLSTGNFNWFNFHTILLCIPLLDDQFLTRYTPKMFAKILGIEQFAKQEGIKSRKLSSYVENLLLPTGVLIGLFAIYFPYDGNAFKINFDMAYLRNTLINSYPLIACVSLAVLFTFFNLLRYNLKSVPFKMTAASKALKLIFSVGFFCSVFFVSLIPFFSGIEAKPELLPVFSSSLHGLYSKLQPFQIVNPYGLFRHMTGVEGRPELIIQGSYDQVDWKDYEFIYKPGDLTRRCKFNTPHQPRLDWQMWFAALGEINREPWLVSMMGRLFSNSPSVLDLIAKNPFEGKPPQYLRILRYKYAFSPLEAPQEWRILDPKGEEYLWSINRNDPTLINYIRGHSSQKITEQSMYPVHPWQKIPILSIVSTAIMIILMINLLRKRRF